MTDSKDQDDKKPLSLNKPGKLQLNKTVDAGQVRQSFSQGRSKMVQVEVKKKRTFETNANGKMAEVKEAQQAAAEAELKVPAAEPVAEEAPKPAPEPTPAPAPTPTAAPTAAPVAAKPKPIQVKKGTLTESERANRAKVLDLARKAASEPKKLMPAAPTLKAEPKPEPKPEPKVEAKVESKPAAAPAAPEKAPARSTGAKSGPADAPAKSAPKHAPKTHTDPDKKKRGAGAPPNAPRPSRGRGGDDRRKGGKLTIDAAMRDGEERTRSLAAVRRAREKEKQKQQQQRASGSKIVREVIVPETITVQELANRMAERGVDVIRELMKMGIMATVNQVIDPDTAELVIAEFGHNMKRVSDADVEIGLKGADDNEVDMISRPPVVTVMGHVDHGKTSLLDALRATDVVAGEAGGITQHIGAYQVTLESNDKITFIDTPGHAAFTDMRARGAKVTDIVILVVAADDGIMPQTIEAIHHAKAANVPIIVAINKMDKPDADAQRVRNELLQHEILLEEVGGDVLAVEVSAKGRLNLDKLEEAILLQAEILDLKSNPDRPAEGFVVEAKMERGRGSVATVLVQRGTLKHGDVFVAGAQWGRVRALVDDHGNQVDTAGPSVPVEILGLNGTPHAGDEVAVVDGEARAREITEYRSRKARELQAAATARGTLDQLFEKIKEGEAEELPVVIKSDVHGSQEAILATLAKMGTSEVKVRVLHAAVGGINESDVILARAAGGMVIGFNVRANVQARDLAKRDGVDLRYYSIIYDVTDDIKAMLSGMLAPDLKENFLGNAQIREVFNVTKVGKVAGCMVTDGQVKRGAKVRLLRDDVVIHEGELSQLKRFKDDAKEVREGMECGMSFANYDDIKVNDVIECFEIEEVAREL